MQMFIDGDAFPNALKPIIARTIERTQLHCTVIANKKIHIADSPFISTIIVAQGADEADHHIVERCHAGDLVITADIPLADRIISLDADAIDHRGERYSKENIKQYLAMRNLMQELRDSGEITSGPKPFSQKDVHAFANALHSYLQERLKQ